MGKKASFHNCIPRELPVFMFLAVLCGVLALATDTFAKADNLRILGMDAAAIGIISVGLTAVIVTGGIDLSVASTLALSAVAGGQFIAQGHVTLGVAVALLVGVGCGTLNGLLITLMRIPPIIATLGTLYVYQAAATLISGGQCIILQKGQLSLLGRGFDPLLLMLGVFAVGIVAMRSTGAGRHVYAIGGNEESARLAGISPGRVKMGVYVISGMLSALAGLVMMGVGSTFQANDATGYELAAIAAVVIGGTSIMGGQGSVVGTLVGVGISTVLRNGAILVGLDARWAQAVVGAAIFLAVAVERVRRR